MKYRLLENLFLEMRYESIHIHACSLYSCVAQEFKLGLGCIQFERSLDSTQLDTPGMTPLHDRSARNRGPYLRNTQQTQWTNIHALIGVFPATKRLDQQDGRLLIYCTLNSLFLNTVSSYDAVNSFKLST